MPALVGIAKPQITYGKKNEKQPQIMRINNPNNRSIKHAPRLDNFSINSYEGHNEIRG